MEPITKRALQSFEEIADVCEVEKKKQEYLEFMSGTMAGHQHRISLVLRAGAIRGTTERVQGHVHKVDLAMDDHGDILGFSGITDNHKHRLSFRVKTVKGKGKGKDEEEK